MQADGESSDGQSYLIEEERDYGKKKRRTHTVSMSPKSSFFLRQRHEAFINSSQCLQGRNEDSRDH